MLPASRWPRRSLGVRSGGAAAGDQHRCRAICRGSYLQRRRPAVRPASQPAPGPECGPRLAVAPRRSVDQPYGYRHAPRLWSATSRAVSRRSCRRSPGLHCGRLPPRAVSRRAESSNECQHRPPWRSCDRVRDACSGISPGCEAIQRHSSLRRPAGMGFGCGGPLRRADLLGDAKYRSTPSPTTPGRITNSALAWTILARRSRGAGAAGRGLAAACPQDIEGQVDRDHACRLPSARREERFVVHPTGLVRHDDLAVEDDRKIAYQVGQRGQLRQLRSQVAAGLVDEAQSGPGADRSVSMKARARRPPSAVRRRAHPSRRRRRPAWPAWAAATAAAARRRR